jgi:hypothetical protein
MKLLAVITVLVLMSVTAYAADVDGTWTGSLTGPQGEIPMSFTFKADGAKLTGSTVGFDGSQVPIKDGKIDGSNIAFSVSIDFGGMPFVLAYKGVVAADQIKMTGDFAGMPFEFVLKKPKQP